MRKKSLCTLGFLVLLSAFALILTVHAPDVYSQAVVEDERQITSATSSFPPIWSITQLDNTEVLCAMQNRSLLLDSAERPHIAYGCHALYYTWSDGTSWHLETVDDSEDVGRFASLALDSNDSPHISYYDNTNGALKYAYRNGDGWQIQTIDSSAGKVGQYTSLELDTNDYARISYLSADQSSLKYARWTGSIWITQTVDDPVGQLYYTSLALDSNARPHICYTELLTGWLWSEAHLRCVHSTGTTWTTDTIESEIYVSSPGFEDISLVSDKDDKLHVSYYVTEGDLKYAYRAGSSWVRQTVDSRGDTGRATSVGLDEHGKLHISYVDWTDRENHVVKHGFWAGTGWRIQKVADTNEIVLNTSVALDQSGNPHIGYYLANGDIYYAVGTDPVGVMLLPIVQRQ